MAAACRPICSLLQETAQRRIAVLANRPSLLTPRMPRVGTRRWHKRQTSGQSARRPMSPAVQIRAISATWRGPLAPSSNRLTTKPRACIVLRARLPRSPNRDRKAVPRSGHGSGADRRSEPAVAQASRWSAAILPIAALSGYGNARRNQHRMLTGKDALAICLNSSGVLTMTTARRHSSLVYDRAHDSGDVNTPRKRRCRALQCRGTRLWCVRECDDWTCMLLCHV